MELTMLQVMSEIQGQFSKHLEEGLLDVISPPAEYYPDMANLRKVRFPPLPPPTHPLDIVMVNLRKIRCTFPLPLF